MAGRGTDIVLGGKEKIMIQIGKKSINKFLMQEVCMLLVQKGMNLEELIIN